MSTGSLLPAETVRVPPSLAWLAPIAVESLIRVGGKTMAGTCFPGPSCAMPMY